MIPGARILVVDDEALPRLLLSTTLKETGYEVVEAEGGQAALDLLREQEVDLVLLDLVMPDPDGFHVLKQMKADDSLASIPVVVVSSSDDMNSVVRCIKMGAADHLSKPFDPVLLHLRVRGALGPRRPERGPESSIRSASLTMRLGRRAAGAGGAESAEGGGRIPAFLGSLFRWCRPYRPQLAFFAALVVAALAIEAALPLGLKFITDDALLKHNLRALIVIAAVLVTALVVTALAQVAADRYYVRFAVKVLNDIRFQMFRHLQQLSIGFFMRTATGSLMARFTTDLAAVENTVLLCLPLAFAQFLLVVFSLGLLFAIEWKLALFSVIGLGVSYALEHRIEGPAYSADALVKEQQARITAVLQETVAAQPVVKVFRLQGLVTERFKHQMVKLYGTAARACYLCYLTEKLPGRCIALFGLIAVMAGAFFTYYGFLTIGELISFQVLLTGLTSAAGELTWSVPHLVRAAAGMGAIEKLLAETPDVVDAPDAVPLPRPVRDIIFSNVTFGYTEGRASLRDVTLVIPLGCTALLVGPSGCGKSTALNLLMRFYDPWRGFVLIDGTDIRSVKQDSLRQHMAVVLQENFLFDTTIRENIRMGRQWAGDQEIEAAAKAAEMHEIIMGFRDGYETVVGERGSRLSGGQRQRLAIARALISDPVILLLDEATSALDPATAAAIESALERIAKGRTVISVTHRLESAPKADLIFTFDEGRVVESGSHAELLRANRLYSRLWSARPGPLASSDSSS